MKLHRHKQCSLFIHQTVTAIVPPLPSAFHYRSIQNQSIFHPLSHLALHMTCRVELNDLQSPREKRKKKEHNFIWDRPWLVLTTETTGRGPAEAYFQRTAFWEIVGLLLLRARRTDVGRKYFELQDNVFERIMCLERNFLKHTFTL